MLTRLVLRKTKLSWLNGNNLRVAKMLWKRIWTKVTNLPFQILQIGVRYIILPSRQVAWNEVKLLRLTNFRPTSQTRLPFQSEAPHWAPSDAKKPNIALFCKNWTACFQRRAKRLLAAVKTKRMRRLDRWLSPKRECLGEKLAWQLLPNLWFRGVVRQMMAKRIRRANLMRSSLRKHARASRRNCLLVVLNRHQISLFWTLSEKWTQTSWNCQIWERRQIWNRRGKWPQRLKRTIKVLYMHRVVYYNLKRIQISNLKNSLKRLWRNKRKLHC